MQTPTLFFLLPLLAATACHLHEAPVPDPTCSVDWEVDGWGAGPAPWSGLFLDVDAHADSSVEGCEYDMPDDVAPWVVDADGNMVDLEPSGACPRWLPPGGFTPGDYTWKGFRGLDLPDPLDDGDVFLGDRPFTIEPWGGDEAFDPTAVAGKSYLVSMEEFSTCDWLWDLMNILFAGQLHLEVHAVEGTDADIRLVREPLAEDEATCALMAGTASLSATGDLRWSAEEVTLDSSPALTARGLSIRAGFDAEGTEARGVEGTMDLDLRGIEATNDFDTWEDACLMMASFGKPCAPCPDGVEACLDFELYGGTALVEDRVPDSHTPPCFISADMPDWEWDSGWEPPDCEPTCSAREPGAWAGLWLLAGLALLRRRRAGS